MALWAPWRTEPSELPPRHLRIELSTELDLFGREYGGSEFWRKYDAGELK